MNLGNIQLDLQFEKAVKLLVQYMPVGEKRKKPLLMHVLRVGMYLYEHDYSADIVLAGLLHDILEWTEASEGLVKSEFGDAVLAIVKANTKDRSIVDPAERRREYIDRCIAVGESALIVKTADTLDSYRFYRSVDNTDEIARSVDIAKTILEKIPNEFKDPIFTELRSVSTS
ncbi:MAG: HD domain-containing protein [Patescibacteria group bacterium]